MDPNSFDLIMQEIAHLHADIKQGILILAFIVMIAAFWRSK
jgi:hypothetical protein